MFTSANKIKIFNFLLFAIWYLWYIIAFNTQIFNRLKLYNFNMLTAVIIT